jgi:hypothetical protein
MLVLRLHRLVHLLQQLELSTQILVFLHLAALKPLQAGLHRPHIQP